MPRKSKKYFLLRLKKNCDITHKIEGFVVFQMTISAWYAIPSLIYAFNNNIYYFALHYATPPVWNIIIQLRIIFTAFTYKFIFRRAMTSVQVNDLKTIKISGVKHRSKIDLGLMGTSIIMFNHS